MKMSEFREMVEWIGARFPDKPWTAEQVVVYFSDLQDQDASDVWTGLLAFYEEGQRFAPNGSQLLNAARKERRRLAIDDLYRQSDRALPSPEKEPVVTDGWDSMSTKRFDEVLTPMEYVARIHADSTKCRSTTCEIHNEAVV